MQRTRYATGGNGGREPAGTLLLHVALLMFGKKPNLGKIGEPVSAPGSKQCNSSNWNRTMEMLE